MKVVGALVLGCLAVLDHMQIHFQRYSLNLGYAYIQYPIVAKRSPGPKTDFPGLGYATFIIH